MNTCPSCGTKNLNSDVLCRCGAALPEAFPGATTKTIVSEVVDKPRTDVEPNGTFPFAATVGHAIVASMALIVGLLLCAIVIGVLLLTLKWIVNGILE